jgi:hypothetical protein
MRIGSKIMKICRPCGPASLQLTMR